MTESARTTGAAGSRRPVLLAMMPLLLAGCGVTQTVQQVESLESAGGAEPVILLMPPDIRYYRLTVGGVREPHAEWTEEARSNFSVAVQAFAAEAGMEFTPLNDEEMTPAGIRYRKLHEAVGHSVMLHHFGAEKLPSKEGVFDWSLGPGVREIAEQYDADYALFASYRDEEATGGRLALSMLAGVASAAATGVAVMPKTEAEFGFASLVDLRTGEIVWLNVVRSGTGELRKPKWARTAVDTLFKDMP